jgi:type II secretory pathway component GspD/PulD (secretin)
MLPALAGFFGEHHQTVVRRQIMVRIQPHPILKGERRDRLKVA